MEFGVAERGIEKCLEVFFADRDVEGWDTGAIPSPLVIGIGRV